MDLEAEEDSPGGKLHWGKGVRRGPAPEAPTPATVSPGEQEVGPASRRPWSRFLMQLVGRVGV